METKCSAFWHHTNVRSDNRVFPCCRFKEPVQQFDGNLETILTTDAYKKLREQSLAGIPIKGCEKCYYEESLGRKSLREQFNEDYDCKEIELNFLEVGFDNICNLTCDGCWGEFSSSWAKKTNPNEIHIHSTVDFINIPSTLSRVLFLGGEPLMTTRHAKFLSALPNKKLVDVIYNTNGTFFLSLETQTLLRQFKSVKFILSIDGFGLLNDKVRSGSHWNDIVDFIHQVKRLPFELVIHSVIHINNWHGLADLEKFIKQINLPWTINVLTYPKHLDIANIEDKTDILNVINNSNVPNKAYILKHLA